MVGGLSVSDHTEARLRAHLGHLIRWNAAINLVAKSTIPDAWERHVADSAQLVDLAPGNPGHWADLGSGAGFPGFVVAVIMAETSPETRVTLVEADRRKATFLRESARLLDLDVTVRAERIEDAAPLCADVISARALAPLDQLVTMARPHLRAGGMCLFLKGARIESELATASAAWSFSVERLPSRTDASAEILRLKGLADA